MDITFQLSVNRHITTCRKLWPASIYDFEFFQRIDPGRPLGSVFVHRIWFCEQRSSHHGNLHYDHDSGEIIRRAAGCTSWKRERQRSHNVFQRGVVRPSFNVLECRRIGSVPFRWSGPGIVFFDQDKHADRSSIIYTSVRSNFITRSWSAMAHANDVVPIKLNLSWRTFRGQSLSTSHWHRKVYFLRGQKSCWSMSLRYSAVGTPTPSCYHPHPQAKHQIFTASFMIFLLFSHFLSPQPLYP